MCVLSPAQEGLLLGALECQVETRWSGGQQLRSAQHSPWAARGRGACSHQPSIQLTLGPREDLLPRWTLSLLTSQMWVHGPGPWMCDRDTCRDTAR